MCRLLRAAGFVPISSRGAEEFLGDPVHEHFSAVLLEANLGGMSGLELRRQLPKKDPPLGVIFITSVMIPKCAKPRYARDVMVFS
jgi:FixJ family two-component response regulator